MGQGVFGWRFHDGKQNGHKDSLRPVPENASKCCWSALKRSNSPKVVASKANSPSDNGVREKADDGGKTFRGEHGHRGEAGRIHPGSRNASATSVMRPSPREKNHNTETTAGPEARKSETSSRVGRHALPPKPQAERAALAEANRAHPSNESPRSTPARKAP